MLNAAALSDAMRDARILEARSIICDNEHNLIVDLKCMRGIIPREEGALGIREGTVRDIAIISRVNKPVCFVVTDFIRDAAGRITACLLYTSGITDRDGVPVADRIAGADTLPHPGGNADARSRADCNADRTAGIRRREHAGRLRHGLVPAADDGRRDCGRQRADR